MTILLDLFLITACDQVDLVRSKVPDNDRKPASISPTTEPVNVGYAGEDPADIARYLLARGAEAAELSPDGENIAFRYSITGQPQLWVVQVDSGQPQQLTFGNGITFFRWSPDGKAIFYGADTDGNEQEAYYAVTPDGRSERLVLPAAEGGFRVFGDFSADGKMYAYASTERNGLDYDIYTADAGTGERRRVYAGHYGFFVRAVSPDGTRLVLGETVGEDSDNLYLLHSADGSLKTVSQPESRANHTSGGIAWSQNGDALYLATNRNREYAALVRYDIDAGAFETVFETDADVENVRLCGKSDRYLTWTVNDGGYSRLHARVLATEEALAAPSLPEGVYQLSCSTRSDLLAVQVNGWATPGDIYVWNLRTGKSTLAFQSNLAGLDPKRLIHPQSIRIPARDGVLLQGLLYLPDKASLRGAGLPPVVFDIHGGPTDQSRPDFSPSVQYLADRGIAVFQPNVRGSTGFGRTYATLDDREKRLDSLRDLVDMLDYLREDGRVDTERAAVRGGSYGGYMVNAALAAYPGRFKAGVCLFGVADWVTALEIASPALKASDRIEYGDITDAHWRAFYEENSPIRQANRITVPVLYSHGERDPRIDIAETETMVRALRAQGIEAPFIRIPDEGHGWRKLSNRLFYGRWEAEFLESQFSGIIPVGKP